MENKKCRFCQMEDLSVERVTGIFTHYYVYCSCCESRGPVARSKEQAKELYFPEQTETEFHADNPNTLEADEMWPEPSAEALRKAGEWLAARKDD